MADMDKMVFEYQDIRGIRLVTLDSKFSDYDFSYIIGEDGRLMESRPPSTIKDCRHIDGCVYFHMGHVPEFVVNEKIEYFQKVVKDRDLWKENKTPGLVVPDDVRFKF